MAVDASLVFTLSVYACVYTGVECVATCSNIVECTMYNIQQVRSKVDSMQSNMAAIVYQLSQIQEIQQQMKTERKELQLQMATQRQQIQYDLANQNQTIAHQKEDVASRSEEIASYKEEIANQKAEIMSQKEEIQKLTHKLRPQLRSYVSVTAYAAKTRGYRDGRQVLFDGTLRNYGSAYSVDVSKFICPVDAYYMISISLLAGTDNKIHGMIMLDDEELVMAFAKDEVTKPSSSQIVVTYCEAGQRIWVQCIQGNTNYNRMYGQPTLAYSTFGVTFLSF